MNFSHKRSSCSSTVGREGGVCFLLEPMQPYCICVLCEDRAGACFHRLDGFQRRISTNLSFMDMSGGICITEALVLYDMNVSALASHTEFARVQEKKNLSYDTL